MPSIPPTIIVSRSNAAGRTLLKASTDNEESERWIGEWMEARGNRDQMASY